MNATPENRVRTGRPPLYGLIAGVCETMPKNDPGERLEPDEYRRLEQLRMDAAAALEELVDQMGSLSMVLGVFIESEVVPDSRNAAGCAFLLQTLADITAALREVEARAETALRWSDQAGHPPGQQGQARP